MFGAFYAWALTGIVYSRLQRASLAFVLLCRPLPGAFARHNCQAVLFFLGMSLVIFVNLLYSYVAWYVESVRVVKKKKERTVDDCIDSLVELYSWQGMLLDELKKRVQAQKKKAEKSQTKINTRKIRQKQTSI